MVISNQKSTIYTQKKKKESTHNTKDSHQVTREQKKGEQKTYNNKSKTINKMTIRAYISIITLNVNGLNTPSKRQSG